ncbi:hypothetical protein FACS1894186_0270 [Alphaproteobacteria bacterium]|nr:hypothetical protein FACS1894186_0270 [Alphaproteobacteria bacterium]
MAHYISTPEQALMAKAVEYASACHREQIRKTDETPYIAHPIRVMSLLSDSGYPVEVVCAGVLHDVLEDGRLPDGEAPTKEGLALAFGPKIASLVAAVSEKQSLARQSKEEKRLTWAARKKAALDFFSKTDAENLPVKVADCLDNTRSLAAQVDRYGSGAFEVFNATWKEMGSHAWKLNELLHKRLAGTAADPMLRELTALNVQLYPLSNFDTAGRFSGPGRGR